MKKKYKLHPSEYAVGQTEKFYAEMAQKGWILEKRGTYLSRFRHAEPQKTLYKVELSCPSSYGDSTAPPQELKALYEASGWTFVVRRGLINIFSAPVGAPKPEIPDGPERYISVRRVMLKNAAAAALVFAVAVCGLAVLAGRGLLLEMRLAWYTDTAKMLLVGAALTLLLFDAASGALHEAMLLGKWKPVGGSGRFRRAFFRILMTGCFIFALLVGFQLYSTRKSDMPQEADGPYILLSELGWTGERTFSYEKDDVSAVTHVRSLLSEQWYTKEFVKEQPDGAECMLRQEIYRLKSPKEAMAIIPSVMSESVFARGEDEYTKVDVPGLDAAWKNAFEYIAVKDSTVYYLIYLDSSTGTPAGPKTDLLQSLAEISKYRP